MAKRNTISAITFVEIPSILWTKREIFLKYPPNHFIGSIALKRIDDPDASATIAMKGTDWRVFLISKRVLICWGTFAPSIQLKEVQRLLGEADSYFFDKIVYDMFLVKSSKTPVGHVWQPVSDYNQQQPRLQKIAHMPAPQDLPVPIETQQKFKKSNKIELNTQMVVGGQSGYFDDDGIFIPDDTSNTQPSVQTFPQNVPTQSAVPRAHGESVNPFEHSQARKEDMEMDAMFGSKFAERPTTARAPIQRRQTDPSVLDS